MEAWDGVRNYQARNFMRDGMRRNDLAFFYHSSCEEPGIVGIVRIASAAEVDPTQFDPEQHHYDPKSNPEDPRWYLVRVQLVRRMKRIISLTELRKHSARMPGFNLLMPGSRLSVMPVRDAHWNYVLKLEEASPPAARKSR
jgi:predicted RNA-binding protein with PUA-like domain